ncbi:MAG: hypothetical protein AAGC82_15440 [Pseudomonadota bacterium]
MISLLRPTRNAQPGMYRTGIEAQLGLRAVVGPFRSDELGATHRRTAPLRDEADLDDN